MTNSIENENPQEEPQNEGLDSPSNSDEAPSVPEAESTPPGGAEVTVNPATFAPLEPKPQEGNGITNLDMLLDIGLKVSVELGRTLMSIREVLELSPGTVVELDRIAGEPVDILINGKPIAKGEVVVIGDMFGVRVTDIVSPAQRMETIR